MKHRQVGMKMVPHLFSYFSTEAETNIETSKTNTEADIVRIRYGSNTKQTRTENRWLPELKKP
jgi:hypothetical protein